MLRSTLFQGAALLVGGCLLASPWFWGGVSYFVQMLIAGCACAALIVCVGWTGKSMLERSIPLMFVPLALALVLGGLQLVPLAQDGIFGRHLATVAYWQLLASPSVDQPLPDDAPREGGKGAAATLPIANSVPLSLYPWETRKRLAALACGVSFFVLGAVVFRHPSAQKVVLGFICLNGCGVALSGLAQKWSVQTQAAGYDALHANRLFGPYINKNNGAGYVLLALSIGIGLSLWSIDRQRNSRPAARDNARRETRSGYDRPLDASSSSGLFDANAICRLAPGLICVALLVAGIAASMSRSAIVAMVAATVVTLGASGSEHRRRLVVLMGGGSIVSLVVLVLMGHVGTVAARVASLVDWSIVTADSRFPHWMDAWRAGEAFGLFGSGLGTYRFVYPLWSTTVGEEWFHHAENQFLETFVETGVVGTLLLLFSVVLFAHGCWQLLQSRELWYRILGVTGCFMLASQVVHGISDFSLYLPANTITMAVVCGLIAGTAHRLDSQSHRSGMVWFPAGWRHQWEHYFGLSLRPALALLAAVLLIGAGDLREAEALSRTYRVTTPGIWSPPSDYAETVREIRVLTRVLDRQPGDARGHRDLGELWIHAYRQWVARQQTGNSYSSELSPLTAPMYLHARAHRFKNADVQALAAIQSDVWTQRYLDAAVFHFQRARQACPLLTLPHLRLAQLALVSGDVSDEGVHLSRVQRLCGSRSDLLRACGAIAWNAGRKEKACEYWRRALTTSTSGLHAILNYVNRSDEIPLFIDRILPERPAIRLQVAQDYLTPTKFMVVRQQLIDRVEERLPAYGLSQAGIHHVQGQIYRMEGSHRQAYQSYRLALQMQPKQGEWRFEFSLLLQEMGMLQTAYTEAVQCYRETPHNVRYQERVKMLEPLLGQAVKQEEDK